VLTQLWRDGTLINILVGLFVLDFVSTHSYKNII